MQEFDELIASSRFDYGNGRTFDRASKIPFEKM